MRPSRAPSPGSRPPGRRRGFRALVAARLVGAFVGAFVGAVGGAVGGAPAVAKEDPYAKELATHASSLKSRSFHRRTAAWRALADTRDARALQLFVNEYERAATEPQVRAFLASIACDTFETKTDLVALRAWRDTRRDDDDAWLWYRVGLHEVEHGGAAEVVARLRDTKLAAPLRGASLLALAAWADPSVPDAITALLDASSPTEPQRGLLVECCARALRSQAGRWGSPAYTTVALRLVGLVADPKVPERTRLLLGRVFAHAAGLPRPLRSATGWRLLLEGAAEPAPDDDGRRYAPPVTFMDVATTGNRIGFVVDASGSMEAPLTTRERDDLRPASPPAGTPTERPKGPTTPDAKDGPSQRRGRDDGAAPPPLAKSSADGLLEVGLRWERIRCRYDAALEFVRAAVARLDEDVRFAAVLFGTRTDDLVRKQGLVPATRANVAGMTKAVDVRLAGSSTLGATNLHGGITRMFRTDEKGFRPDASPLDGILLRDGVDTVYVLSDGAPSADDWDDGTEVGIRSSGTYYEDAQLLDDIDRWNLFRHAEINAISIGTGFGDLLEQLAWRHGGVYRPIPRPKADGDDLPARPALDPDDLLDGLPPAEQARLRRLLGDEAKPPKPPKPAAPLPGSAPEAPKATDGGGGATPDPNDPVVLVQALESDVEHDRRHASRGLDKRAGRRWGFTTGMRPHERAALLRNWTWWLELHPPPPPTPPKPDAPGTAPVVPAMPLGAPTAPTVPSAPSAPEAKPPEPTPPAGPEAPAPR